MSAARENLAGIIRGHQAVSPESTYYLVDKILTAGWREPLDMNASTIVDLSALDAPTDLDGNPAPVVEWGLLLRHMGHIDDGYTESEARAAVLEDGIEDVGAVTRTLPGDWAEVPA